MGLEKKTKITLVKNNEEEVEYFVLEQTKISGINYLLVTDSEDEDGEAMILKDSSKDEEAESVYEELTQEELEAVFPVFEKLLDDVDFI